VTTKPIGIAIIVIIIMIIIMILAPGRVLPQAARSSRAGRCSFIAFRGQGGFQG
jgi:Sec-independent protein translocase protein TatA